MGEMTFAEGQIHVNNQYSLIHPKHTFNAPAKYQHGSLQVKKTPQLHKRQQINRATRNENTDSLDQVKKCNLKLFYHRLKMGFINKRLSKNI